MSSSGLWRFGRSRDMIKVCLDRLPPMLRIALLIAVLALAVFGPQLWVRRVFAKYGTPREDFPGTGGELARHLLDRFDMKQVKVEPTEVGDHYDPLTKTVRLSPETHGGRSLTAVTVAAHEVGHAMQDRAGFAPLVERTRLLRLAQGAQKAGVLIMFGIPVIAALTRAPATGLLVLLAGVLTMGIATLVHLVTLPVEWDASFRRALPVLEQGGYVSATDLEGARRILTAAAFTYVAASLASLLNLWRWLAFLRR